ncbi:MAG: hypothetical protein WCR59_07685 [Planctomycetota bacterium]
MKRWLEYRPCRVLCRLHCADHKAASRHLRNAQPFASPTLQLPMTERRLLAVRRGAGTAPAREPAPALPRTDSAPSTLRTESGSWIAGIYRAGWRCRRINKAALQC